MNLIANTGIQLFTFPLNVDGNDKFKMFFHEWIDTKNAELKLEIAHYFSKDDIWVRKKDLADLGYAVRGNVKEDWEDIKEDFIEDDKFPIKIETQNAQDSGCFQVSASNVKWGKFENKWLPFPFFLLKNKKSEFGPTNWCRFKLVPSESQEQGHTHNLILAFDTRTQFADEEIENEGLYETPVFGNNYERSKEYALCNSEYTLLDYFSKSTNCEWVDEHLLKMYHDINDINNLRVAKPKLKYLAQYIYIINYIQKLNTVPNLTLFSNKNVSHGNVDLVVDIGNSRTCAVLFDNNDFTKTSPLELQDFTNPLKEVELNKHRDSFDMRLAFRDVDFGQAIGRIGSKQFIFPSLIRLGKEANNLVHKATNMNTGTEKTSTFSSPKRYLWDNTPQKQEWEFVQFEGEPNKPIYIKGISEQLNVDGSLNIDGAGGVLTHYSRKALMTFAFLEILAQAKMQINSYEQRKHWGNESTPRQINRIIVTSPTSMSKVEQIALRKSAEDAAIMLNRYYDNAYLDSVDEKDIRSNIQVIPSAKTLQNNDEENFEWTYDEATAAQFVFLYAEVGVRYMKNIKEYFDFYGKQRTDLGDYNKKSLTVGSVDIGAGTTDVMIAAYKYDDDGQCNLTPSPLFWESFYIAGDDLLKEMIHQLVIEGKYSPIEQKLKSLDYSQSEIVELNNDFFGGDNGMSFSYRQLRKDFNLQLSVPIAVHYLELLKEGNVKSKILSFHDIFDSNLPSQNVLKHFESHFGFDFRDLKWQFEQKLVTAIVEKTFDTLIGKISSLFSFYGCDIVLLSGRPTSLKSISDLFLKYYAISPNRLKTMNNYRIGRWYPEDKRHKSLDGSGFLKNPKSIITTGAMIGYLATKGDLDGFSLNLNELAENMKATTEYFGKLNSRTLEFTETIISPDNNRSGIKVSSLPVRIGTRQLDIKSYPSRPFFTLNFNIERIEDRVKGRIDDEDNVEDVQRGLEKELDRIKESMPLSFTLERDYTFDKETLKIESVLTQAGEELNSTFFKLQVQSMSEIENFWLDSGIFTLNTDNGNI